MALLPFSEALLARASRVPNPCGQGSGQQRSGSHLVLFCSLRQLTFIAPRCYIPLIILPAFRSPCSKFSQSLAPRPGETNVLETRVDFRCNPFFRLLLYWLWRECFPLNKILGAGDPDQRPSSRNRRARLLIHTRGARRGCSLYMESFFRSVASRPGAGSPERNNHRHTRERCGFRCRYSSERLLPWYRFAIIHPGG
jgi:hypothetical protein